MNTRSFTNAFEITDWTKELTTIPNQWGTLQNLGLFATESVAQNTVSFEEEAGVLSLVKDQVRGHRAQKAPSTTRKVRAFPVPHFPMDDAIYPQDIQGIRAYGSPDAVDNLAAVRMRKMETIRRCHAATLEVARAKAIVSGDVYAPNQTIIQNWDTEFGNTRKTISFALANNTTDVAEKVEEAIYHMQSNLGNGGIMSGVLVMCSREFFSALIKHPKVVAAYTYYSSSQEPLRNRLASDVNLSTHRMFVWQGATFMEMNDIYDGERLIPANEAHFVPLGTDAFVTYFAPANKFQFANTLGEEAYMFEYAAQTDSQITIESESNFINVVRRPQALVKATAS